MSSEDNKIADIAGILSQSPQYSALNTGLFGMGNISNVFGRPEVRGLYYNGQRLTLDGYSFVNCRFDNCILEVTSTNFDLIQCVVDPSTRFEYGPMVLKIIQLFNSRYDWAYQHFPQFAPIVNPNGSITISDRRV